MYHHANQSKKSTLFPSRTPVSKSSKVPGIFPSLFRKIGKIVRFPIQRVDLTAEGLQCLELIFETNKQNDAYVNLTTFINKVKKSESIVLTLGNSRANVIIKEVCKLDHKGAHNDYMLWHKLRDSLEQRTLLNFPISRESRLQLEDYAKLLSQKGIPASSPLKVIVRNTNTHETITDQIITGNSSRYDDQGRILNAQYENLRNPVDKSNEAEEIHSLKGERSPFNKNSELDLYSRIDAKMAETTRLSSLGQLWQDEMVVDVPEGINEEERIQALRAMRYLQLSEEENDTASSVLNGPNNLEILIEKFNTPMDRNKMMCLKPSQWLNDEVINFYMCMLKERDSALCTKDPERVANYFFNSFFLDRLLVTDNGYKYANIKRWSKKIDVFKHDKIFFPVNLSNTHWTMMVVYMQRKEIHYYDSMSGSGKRYLDALKRWLVDEAMDKKKQALDVSDWVLVDREDGVPQQKNGVDCGMFSTMCADFISDNLPIDYRQVEIPFFRRKVTAAILRGSLDYEI